MMEDHYEQPDISKTSDRFNDAFVGVTPEDNPVWEKTEGQDEAADVECGDQFSDEEVSYPSNQEYVIRFRNAAFSWGVKNDALVELDDLDIPAGQCIQSNFYFINLVFIARLHRL